MKYERREFVSLVPRVLTLNQPCVPQRAIRFSLQWTSQPIRVFFQVSRTNVHYSENKEI